MQIPLMKGRFFQPNERLGHSQFAIVSQSFVSKFFPNADPIGKDIDDDNFAAPHNFEIIGVVADVRGTLASDTEPTFYLPLFRGEENSASLAVVTGPDPLSIALPIQKIIADMDPNLAVSDILTMDQILGRNTLDAGFETTLLVVFAAVSLLLAAVGLFGVLSYLVGQRQGGDWDSAGFGGAAEAGSSLDAVGRAAPSSGRVDSRIDDQCGNHPADSFTVVWHDAS